jgi:hypothetical protein
MLGLHRQLFGLRRLGAREKCWNVESVGEVEHSGQVVWNTTDDDGRSLPGGIYFMRLDAGETTH